MMMGQLVLAAGLLAVGAAGPDAADLIVRLGAARYAERQEASRALESMGRDALPALRRARDSKDPEVRSRVADLIDRIESELMVRPTTVRLDFRDQPLTEVVNLLSIRAGIPIALVPENSVFWQSRRVTLEADQPVPFWTMLDRLCQAGQVRPNVGTANGMVVGNRDAAVQLFQGGPVPPLPTSDRGPFRTTINGLHYQRDRNFGAANGNGSGVAEVIVVGPGGRQVRNIRPDPNGGDTTESFMIDLTVLAEPRMSLTQNGPLRLTEAIDDRGQSLLPADEPAPSVRSSGYFGYNTGGVPSVRLQAQLRYPAQPGRTIRLFRGTLPVTVSARKDEPLVIPLADAKGKTFQTEDVLLTINGVNPAPNNQPGTSIDLSIRPNVSADPTVGGAPAFAQVMTFRTPNNAQGPIEILDAQNRIHRVWYSSSTSLDTDQLRMTLALPPSEGIGPPAQIRFYSMARATTAVEFEFRDVPMP